MSVLGAAVSFIGVGFGAFLIMRMIYGAWWAAEGVFTLFAFLFILIGAQFIAMGVLGEYIGRIYYDVRGRHRYFWMRRCRNQRIIQPDGLCRIIPRALIIEDVVLRTGKLTGDAAQGRSGILFARLLGRTRGPLAIRRIKSVSSGRFPRFPTKGQKRRLA